jgi:UDP-N-acetylmuramate dehydrogenase
MNAGCYGSETWEAVALVLGLSREGQLKRRTPDEYQIAYRHVALRTNDASPITNHESKGTDHRSPITDHEASPVADRHRAAPTSHESRSAHHELFAAAWFRFQPGDAEASRRIIRELLQRRIAAQPLEQPNAGSVFRNPPGDYAARLIESCGLKGRAIGGAMVSRKHANFIINTGRARAADIEALIEEVQHTVLTRCGIALEREVRIIGDRLD